MTPCSHVHGSPTNKLSLLDEWLTELRRRPWTHVYIPNREDVRVHVSLLHWGNRCVVDVIAIFDDCTALAYRAPLVQSGHPFEPPHVTWVFAGEPVWAIRAALALPEPGAAGEPVHPQPPPPLVQGLAQLAGPNRVIRSPRQRP
jgi:hypothetical protein